MFNIFKRKTPPGEAEILVEELSRQEGRVYPFNFANYPAGRKIEAAVPELQRGVALALAKWLANHDSLGYNPLEVKLRSALFILLQRHLPFNEADVILLLDWSLHRRLSYWRGVPQMIKVTDNYLKANPLSDKLNIRPLLLGKRNT